MYNFRDTIPGIGVDSTPLAMSFNGIYLEDEIEGYRTLNVGGRELMPNLIETRGGSGRDGVVAVAKTLPERILTVQYMLRADTSEEFRERYNLLNFLLRPVHNEELSWRYKSIEYQENQIEFTDEPGIYYWGYLESVERVPFDRNIVVGSFTILCPSPWKLTEIHTVYGVPDGTGCNITAPDLTLYTMTPHYIEMDLAANDPTIKIENLTTGQVIEFNTPHTTYTAGDHIEINFWESTVYLTDGIVTPWSILPHLNYLISSFKTFQMRSGDIIRMTPAGSFRMDVEGRWL